MNLHSSMPVIERKLAEMRVFPRNTSPGSSSPPSPSSSSSAPPSPGGVCHAQVDCAFLPGHSETPVGIQTVPPLQMRRAWHFSKSHS